MNGETGGCGLFRRLRRCRARAIAQSKIVVERGAKCCAACAVGSARGESRWRSTRCDLGSGLAGDSAPAIRSRCARRCWRGGIGLDRRIAGGATSSLHAGSGWPGSKRPVECVIGYGTGSGSSGSVGCGSGQVSGEFEGRSACLASCASTSVDCGIERRERRIAYRCWRSGASATFSYGIERSEVRIACRRGSGASSSVG